MIEEQFRYEPIGGDDEGGIIRVLDLHPASGYTVDLISCSLRPIHLSDRPSYEALSYFWGDPTFNKKIICNGKELSITTSLEGALRRFRGSATRTIWADAICINQQDTDEKNQQVRLMRQIYQYAQRVVIWLGDETAHSYLGMNLIRKLVEAGKKREASGDTRTITQYPSGPEITIYNLPGRFEKDWREYFALLKRPWFSRGWIIQEATVAPSITVYCGRGVAPFDDFMAAWLTAGSIGMTEEYDTHSNMALISIALTRQALSKGYPLSLLGLLMRHRTAKTTIPHDKVFALCGIAADAGPAFLDIEIDYHRSSFEVYRQVAINMMTKTQTLDILSVPNEMRDPNFPSWIPDFSSPVLASSLLSVEYNYTSSSSYKASANSRCFPEVSSDGRLLLLQGHTWDLVSKVTDPQPMELGDDDAFHPIESLKDAFRERKRYIDWQHIAGISARRKYITGETMDDVYLETLTAGYNPGPGMISDKATIKAHYLAWKRHTTKHAYLRHLPSPYFEYALAFTLFLSCGWILGRFFICLPFEVAPSEFVAIMTNTANRRLIKTRRGYIGLAGQSVRVGDTIVICTGGKLPLVLRNKGNGVSELVTDCYIHGIMAGEAYREQECQRIWLC